MILFFSDLHLGRTEPAKERKIEASLIACLRAQEAEVEGLYLVGDVFHYYIEYRHLIPKGFVRFQALLAEWTDRGIPVTYLVGNHDPWHRDYFEQELGVRIIFNEITEPLCDKNVHMRHGDGINASAGLYNRLKPLLRHPVPVALYRNVLPGDMGINLARWYDRRFAGREHDEQGKAQLRNYARRILTETNTNLVVMGHSHHAECTTWPEGTYLNPGCWYQTQTFGQLNAEGPALLQWKAGIIQSVNVPEINHVQSVH